MTLNLYVILYRVAGKVTGEVSVPDIIKPTLKTSTPTTSTKDNMVKPEIENQGTKLFFKRD